MQCACLLYQCFKHACVVEDLAVIKVLTVWYGFVGVAAYSSGRERAEQQCEIPADRAQRECVQVSERDMQTSVKPAL